MSYYPEPDGHIRDKVKVALDLTNYVTKKELDLATKKGFIALKAEVDELDINKLANIPASLNNLKTKVDDLDVGKLKTVELIKNTKFHTLKTKVNNLEKKIPNASTLIHINQYNTGKQNLEKKLELLIKKYQIQVVW